MKVTVQIATRRAGVPHARSFARWANAAFARGSARRRSKDTELTIRTDGTLTFTPSGVAGAAEVRVTARDDGGRSGGGNDTSSAENFIITLTPP